MKSVLILTFLLAHGENSVEARLRSKTNRRRMKEDKWDDFSGTDDIATISKTQDGAGCLARLDDGSTLTFADGAPLTIGQGTSVETLLGNACRFPQYYPCYCDVTELSGVRCPFCVFPEASSETHSMPGETCVSEGNSVVFTVGGGGSPQSCGCEYLGDGQVQRLCEDFNTVRDPPPSLPPTVAPVPTTAPIPAPTTTAPIPAPTTTAPIPAPATTAPIPAPTTPAPTSAPFADRTDDNPPPDCLGYAQPCSTSSDCCSQRCIAQSCVRAPVQDTGRIPLANNRGGAAGEARAQGGRGGGINVGVP